MSHAGTEVVPYAYPWCSLCGKVAPVAGQPLCLPCQEAWHEARPVLPKTRDAVLVLPAYALPYALWEYGLRPKGVTRLDKPGCIDKLPENRAPYFYKGTRRWQPQTLWDDAAYLVERYKLSITHRVAYKTGEQEEKWCINDWSLHSRAEESILVIAERFSKIPDAVCRAGILAHLSVKNV